MKPNESRNKELVLKRVKAPSIWSFEKLGKHYRIHKTTAEEIFKRDLPKYASKAQIKKYDRWILATTVVVWSRNFGEDLKRRELSTP